MFAINTTISNTISTPVLNTYPKDHSGSPNLGGKRLKLLAKSDAENVYCIPADKIACGEVAMPFRHAEFAAEYYKTRNEDFYKRFELIAYFSRYRNHRLMKKINVILKENNKKEFAITSDMEDADAQIEFKCAYAKSIGVNPYRYIDVSTDLDDVEQSTNAWCLNQQTTRGKASDNIVIITDLDKVDWFILIERKNGPGRAQAAWAGGFVDPGETFTQAALREKDEETSIDISDEKDSIKFTVSITELPVIISNDWDPRAKFVEGMENGAVVSHYIFTC